jgi:hypothetical protein
MSAQVMFMEAGEGSVQLDRVAMKELRDTVGQAVFDELIEDAIFEVTERIARIEQLITSGDLIAMAPIAHDLVAVAGQVGMSGVSEIAASLERCCLDEATVSAQAIAHRLARVGEASLVAAAEMSVDLATTANGRHAI